jgi:CheY-like chemotaxis protein
VGSAPLRYLDAVAKRTSPILVVDDNVELLELVGEALGLLGYSTRLTRSSEDAAAALATLDPCLILLDSVLPGDGGEDVTGALARRKDGGEFRVVLMSAGRGPQPKNVPHVATLDKPFGLAELSALAERLA